MFLFDLWKVAYVIYEVLNLAYSLAVHVEFLKSMLFDAIKVYCACTNAQNCFLRFILSWVFHMVYTLQGGTTYSYFEFSLCAADKSLLCIFRGLIQQPHSLHTESGYQYFYAYRRISWIWPQRSRYKYLITGMCYEIMATTCLFEKPLSSFTYMPLISLGANIFGMYLKFVLFYRHVNVKELSHTALSQIPGSSFYQFH